MPADLVPKLAAAIQAAPDAEGAAKKLFHRFRHFQGRWSTFDLIEECQRPGGFCCGCEFKHPFCTASGRLLDDAAVSRLRAAARTDGREPG